MLPLQVDRGIHRMEAGLTVTDMNRLEYAARLSMGGLADADVPAKPLPRTVTLRFAALAVVGSALLMLGAFVWA